MPRGENHPAHDPSQSLAVLDKERSSKLPQYFAEGRDRKHGALELDPGYWIKFQGNLLVMSDIFLTPSNTLGFLQHLESE